MESVFSMIQMECSPEPAVNIKKAELLTEKAQEAHISSEYRNLQLFPVPLRLMLLR